MTFLNRYLPAGIFVVVLVAGLWMTAILHRADVQAIYSRFEVVANDAADRVQQRIMEQTSFLKAAHSYVLTQNGAPDRASFAAFVDGLDLPKRYEGIGGIGFSAYVDKGDEAAVSARISAEYNLDAKVWPEETDQSVRAPIMMIEPIDMLRQGALGYDGYSDEARRTALIGAIATNAAHASGPVPLVQAAGDEQRGVLVYFPVRAPGTDADPGPILGFIFGGFYVENLHASTLRRSPQLPVAVRTIDVTNGGEQLVYESPRFEELASTSHFEVIRPISIAGRNWEMTVLATPEFGNTMPSIGIYALGAVSILLAIALAASAHAQIKALESARRLHEESAKSIKDKDLMLQEMKHRIKNSIARVLAIARQTATHSDSLEAFSESFMSRMQAMARAQDMLTRSHWQRANLTELLTTELEQVFGDSVEGYVIPGPVVELNERATQALGLVFHELATNALKYGEISDADGLTVSWKYERNQIVIDWQEHAATPVEAPGEPGFGTRLIDANIKGELGGTVERDYDAAGVHIRIFIPQAAVA